MSLKKRVDKLYSDKITDVTTCIIVKKCNKTVKKKIIGTNDKKMVMLVVNL